MSLRYALIGCGRISPNHIASAMDNKLEIVAMCDLISERIKEKKTMFSLGDNIKEYTDYQEMIKNEKLDLVAIATESGEHAKIAFACLDKKINLIIEKPIALSLEDADLIIKKALENKVKVCACHQNRFNKSISKIREAIELNRFGKLLYGTAHIRWNRELSYYKQAPWRGTWNQDGGALMNQCIHNIDLLRWMMGEEVDEVIGMTDNLWHDFIEAEDLGLAIIKFKNGSYGLIEGTTCVYPKNLEETLYIFGSKGTVKAGGHSVNKIEEWLFKDKLDDPEEVKLKYHENPPTIYGFGHKPLYADVIDAIINDREPYVTAKAGREALELVLAIYYSSYTKKNIKLPLKEGSTIYFKDKVFNNRS